MEVTFVTNNDNKFEEVKRLLLRYNINVKQLKIPMVEIQAESLREIVIYKMANLTAIVKSPFIVEDSGLFILALNGFPGPYSSYVFKKIGNEGILKLLRGIDHREAKFKCVIAYMEVNNIFKIFEGDSVGRISDAPRGKFGFGFDPIFIPQGFNNTLAEMNIDQKNKVSHRGKACRKLAEYIMGD